MTDPQSLQKEYDDYAYAVSHDLGAPIRQIRAFLNFLFDDLDKGKTDEINEYKSQCFNAIDRADLILDRLSDFSRLNAHELQIQKHRVIDFFVPHDRLNIIIDPDLMIDVDPTLFQIIVNELIDNAVKFSDDKTDIYNDGNKIIFKTHGITLTPEYCDKIFEPLRTLQPVNTSHGCGMGLTIAQKAASLQNLNISCDCSDNCILFYIC